MAGGPNILFVDLAGTASSLDAQAALANATVPVTYTGALDTALERLPLQRPSLVVLTCPRLDDVANCCARLDDAHPEGRSYIALVTPIDGLNAAQLTAAGLVGLFPPPADWRAFTIQLDLMARVGQDTQRLEARWQAYEIAMNVLEAACCTVDPKTGTCTASPALQRMLNLPQPVMEKSSLHWHRLLVGLAEADRKVLESAVKSALETGADWRIECEVVSEPRHRLACRGFVRRSPSGQPLQLDIVWQIAGLQTQAAEPSETPAAVDKIGDLAELTHRIESMAKGAILLIRVDNYAELCKTLGYTICRQGLLATIARVSASLRHSDSVLHLNDDSIVTHIGGAEIIAHLDGVEKSQHLTQIRHRVFRKLEEPLSIDGRNVPMKFTIGAARWPHDAKDVDGLLSAAALASEFSDEASDSTEITMAKAQKAVRIEADLYDAIDKDELKLLVQPKYDLATGGVVGFEALLRWHRKREEWVPPNVFIPIAERNGLIDPIGKWVFEEAVRSHARWYAEGLGRLPIAINISSEQFHQSDFVEYCTGTCNTFGVSPHGIGLEITESCLIDDPKRVIAMLGELREAGFEIALDDFGTGFSSLSYLRTLPIDVLKIDRSFISSLDGDSDPGLTAGIIGIGLTRGLRIVAEGIETPLQWQLLSEWGCHEGQGFLMSRPIAPDEIASLVRDGFSPSQFSRSR